MANLFIYCCKRSLQTIDDPHKTFIFLTALFWFITIFTARKIWPYIELPYHSVPVLNHIKTKDDLKESLQGECFEKALFKHSILQKYVHALISENWAIMVGRLFLRNGIKKRDYLHENPVANYKQIKLIYPNGEDTDILAIEKLQMNFVKRKSRICYIKYVQQLLKKQNKKQVHQVKKRNLLSIGT